MREDELSLVSKVGVVALIALAFAAAFANIATGVVVNPRAFWVVLAGLLLFLTAKGSVIEDAHQVAAEPFKDTGA